MLYMKCKWLTHTRIGSTVGIQSTLGIHVPVVPRGPPSKKTYECSAVYRVHCSKLLKFTHPVHLASLNIHNLKLCGIGYVMVTKITVVHIKTGYQKLSLISCYLKNYRCFIHLSYNIIPTSAKVIPPFNKSSFFFLLSL
jgi:hypothetical protein